MSGLSNGQQALMMLLAFLVPLLATVSAWAALGMPADRQSMGLLVSSICGDLSAGIIVFAKEMLGSQMPATSSTSTVASPPKTAITGRLRGFFKEFLTDKQARFPRKRRSKTFYDPGRRHRSHRPRKGVEPAGLRRYRLAHRSTRDPGRHRIHHRRRYDPAPPRRFARARRVGSKLESGLTKWGTAIGAGITALVGVMTGINEFSDKKYYANKGVDNPNAMTNYLHAIIGGDIVDATGAKVGTAPPEISHLWATKDPAGYNSLPWLKYKFLGIDPATGKYTGSAWVIPFWAGIASFILSKLPFGSKLHRIQRPLGKIGLGLAGLGAIGALALPGCQGPIATLPPPPPPKAVVNMSPNTQGLYTASENTQEGVWKNI